MDCFNFHPNDYILNREVCSAEFQADNIQNQKKNEDTPGIGNFLKLEFYLRLKSSIEHNRINQMKAIQSELMNMGFNLSDFPADSNINDYCQGERYMPLLFLAIETRAPSSFQCLINLNVSPHGQIFLDELNVDGQCHVISLRSRAEDLECFDIIEILNDIEDDFELKNIFNDQTVLPSSISLQTLSPVDSKVNIEKRMFTQKKTTKIRRQNSQMCSVC